MGFVLITIVILCAMTLAANEKESICDLLHSKLDVECPFVPVVT